VIAGTGLGLLGIFAGRLNDLLASALNKAASLKGWLPADSILDFITGYLKTHATALLFGTVYAIPARTVINDADRIGGKQQAIIFFAGPAVSFALAILFVLVAPLGGTFRTVGLPGFSMNLLSAAYSLMPFDPMDGNKLYRWKKLFWSLIFLPLLAIYLLSAIYLY
jgi:membrane-associated protease RseP (regulator of RpoE activity)